MDVVRLDANFEPDALVEGWSSMIWTERYSSLGEFSMTTPLIADARAKIPEGSFISLLDADEIMLVETHSIEREDDGGVLAKISGSTFPGFIDERDTIGRGVDTTLIPGNWESRLYYTPAQMVALLLWNNMVDNSYPVAGPVEDLNGDLYERAGDWRLRIPNLEITATNILPWEDPTPDLEAPAQPGYPADKRYSRKWVIDRGPLLRPVSDIMSQGKLGIRSQRPKGRPSTNLSFDNAGLMYSNPSPNGDKVRLNIYQGRDLSDSVVFRYDAGQIEKPTYLYSVRGYKNVVHVSSVHNESSSPGNRDNFVVAAPGVDPNVSGLNRRVLQFDAGDLTDLDPEGFFTAADWDRVLTQKALIELKNYNKVALFDGEISPLNSVKYGQHYSLGDRVTLQAEYDLEATMVVSEYIRSQDENGESGYPTLAIAED